MEIFHYRSRVDEGEIAGELETIRRRGDASAHGQNRPGISRLAPSMTRAAVISKDVNPSSLIVKALRTAGFCDALRIVRRIRRKGKSHDDVQRALRASLRRSRFFMLGLGCGPCRWLQLASIRMLRRPQ